MNRFGLVACLCLALAAGSGRLDAESSKRDTWGGAVFGGSDGASLGYGANLAWGRVYSDPGLDQMWEGVVDVLGYSTETSQDSVGGRYRQAFSLRSIIADFRVNWVLWYHPEKAGLYVLNGMGPALASYELSRREELLPGGASTDERAQGLDFGGLFTFGMGWRFGNGIDIGLEAPLYYFAGALGRAQFPGPPSVLFTTLALKYRR